MTREELLSGAGLWCVFLAPMPGESAMRGLAVQEGGYPEPCTVVSLSAEHIRPDHYGRDDAGAVALVSD